MRQAVLTGLLILSCASQGVADAPDTPPALPPSYNSSDADLDVRQGAIIYLVLKHTAEGSIHRQRGADGNRVFLAPDGHSEVVFDANGDLVKDDMNEGSYNYYHPKNEPLKHYIYDIHPWIMWGASQGDPTTIEEHTYAYMGDLEGGIRRALANKPELESIANSGMDEVQTSVLKLWAVIIEKGDAKALFALFDTNSPPNDATIIAVMQALNKGFDAVY